LANYLLYLNENSTEYNSYFKWKAHISFLSKPILSISPLCSMCIQLHLEKFLGIESKIVHDAQSLSLKRVECIEFSIFASILNTRFLAICAYLCLFGFFLLIFIKIRANNFDKRFSYTFK
jgi:hypothetical protein